MQNKIDLVDKGHLEFGNIKTLFKEINLIDIKNYSENWRECK